MDSVTDKYSKIHVRMDLHQGDIVVVVKKAKSQSFGWCNYWIEEMDEYVGEECEVDFDAVERAGVEYGVPICPLNRNIYIPVFGRRFYFPVFVLKVVKRRDSCQAKRSKNTSR